MTPARAARWLAAAASALWATPSLAQTPQKTPPLLSVETQIVSANVVVFDSAGRFVEGLRPSEVEVLEDGVPQEITYFRQMSGQTGDDRIPLSVVLALDSSASMAKNLRFLQEAAGTFVNKLEEVDAVMIVQFNSSVKGSAEFTSDIERLDSSIQGLEAWGGTSLYDAVYYALERIKGRPGRKAVVVFSDGADHDSTMKEDDVVKHAQTVEATVYSVAIHGESSGFGGTAKGFLRKIAQDSGGLFFFPDRVAELVKVFADIARELHNHYALGYSPKRAPDGTWRTIQVRLKDRQDAQVRVRKGYLAVKARRPSSS